MQASQVVELWWLLFALLLLNLRDGERFSLDSAEGLFAFLFRSELTLGSCECGVAIDSSQHPVGLRLEVVNLFLSIDDERKGRGLYTSYGKHLTVLPVLQRIESSTVHAQQPVSDGAAQSCQVQRLIVGLVFQVLESLADGLVSHRRYPQAADRTLRLSLLHYPALDKLTFLAGVTAVDDALSFLHQTLNDGELLLDALVVDELDAKALWYHGQRCQAPRLPHRGIVVGLFQCTQVPKGPRHLKAVAFHIPFV